MIRGIYGMINSFTVGYKYLMRSAEIAGLDDTDDGAKNGEKKSLVIPQNNADSTDAATSADAPTAEEAVTEAAAESARRINRHTEQRRHSRNGGSRCKGRGM